MADGDARFIALVTELADMEADQSAGVLYLDLGPYSAFILVAALQLAWRHPDHEPRLRDMIERIARRIQDSFAPRYAELIEAGWDTSRDVPAGH